MRLYEIEEEQHSNDMKKCEELLGTSGFRYNVSLTINSWQRKHNVLIRGITPSFFGIRAPRQRTSVTGSNLHNVLLDKINPEMPPRQHSTICAALPIDHNELTSNLYGSPHIIIPKDHTVICNSGDYDAIFSPKMAIIGAISDSANRNKLSNGAVTLQDALAEIESLKKKDLDAYNQLKNVSHNLTLSALGWKLEQLDSILSNSKNRNEVWFNDEAIHIPVVIFKKFIKTL